MPAVAAASPRSPAPRSRARAAARMRPSSGNRAAATEQLPGCDRAPAARMRRLPKVAPGTCDSASAAADMEPPLDTPRMRRIRGADPRTQHAAARQKGARQVGSLTMGRIRCGRPLEATEARAVEQRRANCRSRARRRRMHRMQGQAIFTRCEEGS